MVICDRYGNQRGASDDIPHPSRCAQIMAGSASPDAVKGEYA